MTTLEKRLAALLCVLLAVCLAAVPGCGRDDPPDDDPGALAVLEEPSAYERHLDAGSAAMEAGEYEEAAARYADALQERDMPQARDGIARARAEMAEQAETTRRRVELLGKALDANPSEDLRERLSEQRQRLIAEANQRYEQTTERAKAAGEEGDWSAAVAAYEEAVEHAADAGVDPVAPKLALAQAKEQLELSRRFERMVQEAEEASDEEDFEKAAAGFEAALNLAQEIRGLSEARIEEVAQLGEEAALRKRYNDAVTRHAMAADEEKWDDALDAARTVAGLAQDLDLPEEEAERLARHARRAEDALRRQEAAALLENAAEAIEADRLSEARRWLREARDRTGETEEIQRFAARLRERSDQLEAYLDAKARMEDALEAGRLVEARRAAAETLRAAAHVRPAPKDLPETREVAQGAMAKAEEARRAALDKAEEAEQAGDLETALTLYRDAAELSEHPADVLQRAERVEAAIEERERQAREREERRRRYLAKVQQALQHETVGEYEKAFEVYHQARGLADNPQYINSMIEALQDRAGMSEKYEQAVKRAREADRTGDDAARRSAWREAVRLGRRLRPQPNDLRQHTRTLLELDLFERDERQAEFNAVFDRAVEAEQRGDYPRAIELLRRAAGLAEHPVPVEERVRDLEGRIRFQEAFAAADAADPAAPLRERLAVWKTAYDIGSELVPRPENFEKTAETYLAMEEDRSSLLRRLSEQARADVAAGRFGEAIAALEEARPLSDDPESIDQRIERARVLAGRAERRQRYNQHMAEAARHTERDEMAKAVAAYNKALEYAGEDERDETRALIRDALAREATLAPVHELRQKADEALARGDILDAMAALSQALSRGEKIEPPPRDLAEQQDMLLALERERAARLQERLDAASAHERAGDLARAVEEYRRARELTVDNPEEIARKIAEVEERRRRTDAREHREQYEQLMASAEEALQADRAREAVEALHAARRLADDPGPVDEKLNQAAARAEQLRAYREAVERADSYRRQRYYGEALAAYRAAAEVGAEIDPPPADLGEIEESVAAVEEARREHARERMERGDDAWRRGLLVQALREYRRAAELDDGNEEAAEAVARLENEIAERDASEEYRRSRREQDAFLTRTIERGDRFVLFEDHDNAIIAYEVALTVARQMRPLSERIPEITARLERARNRPAPPPVYENSLGMELRRIEPGEFTMGADSGREFEGPPHRVTLTRPYYMATAPVTNRQYARFLQDTGRPAPSSRLGDLPWEGGRYEEGYGDHPVRGVSHADAEAFCRWLSRTEGRTYRLPTEAEWEHAARAGTATTYYWGREASPSFANSRDAGIDDTTPVGRYPANPWGLHDMLGNVYEWCADRFASYPPGPRTDPTGPLAGRRRAIRGGWFRSEAEEITPAARLGETPETAYPWTGFRVVADAPLGDDG